MTGMQIYREDINTPEHHIRMARIYLFEARKTVHRNWCFVLLRWTGDRRRKAQELRRFGARQKALF